MNTRWASYRSWRQRLKRSGGTGTGLRFEPLEYRLLLSGAQTGTEYVYKSMQFEASGGVSGQVVSADSSTTYSGIGSAEGVIHYTSPLSGTGTAAVESVGTATTAGESAPYTYEGEAAVTDVDGELTLDISSDQFPLTVTGEFNTLSFTGSADWNQGIGAGATITGSWSGPIGPTASGKSDIVLGTASWINGSDTAARFSFRVDGPVMPTIAGRNEPVTDVRVYWAEVADGEVVPLETFVASADVWWNMETCDVTVTGLPAPPPRATHLYLVADEDDLADESSESNNLATLELPGSTEVTELGTVDFLELSNQQLGVGGLRYEFQAMHDACITVQVLGVANVSQVGIDLLDGSGTVLASTQGEGRLDYWEGKAGQTYFVRLTGDSSVGMAFVNLVHKEGSEVTVYGTDQDDAFSFVAASRYGVTINGTEYDFTSSQYESIVFQGGNGDDEATLTGSSETETARLWPDHGTFGESGFLVTVNEVVSITVHGGGGADFAFMYDSAGDDEFITERGYGKLSGQGFALETFDFMYNYGYATTHDGGNDVARMYDTPDADKFKFDWPNPGQFFGKMYGGGLYYNRAKFFERIEAVMTDGKNSARLFDSEGNDTYVGNKSESRLTGPGFDVTVSGYDSIIAYASKGDDVAHLEDSEEDDTVRARSHKVVFWGGSYDDPTYKLTARKFDEYHLEARNGGDDKAKLHDTVFDDYAQATGNSASLYRNQSGLALLYEAVAFEWVRLYGTTNEGEVQNHNTLRKNEPIDFELVYDSAQWDEMP